jgi:hypothetical protein
MVIRGANSDMLARPILNEMLERRGQLGIDCVIEAMIALFWLFLAVSV